jgi:ubiquinone/menaquinone biosynthesis C-methylase UbiE
MAAQGGPRDPARATADTAATSPVARVRPMPIIHKDNRFLEAKYRITSRVYDVLDFPWERQYRHWRPQLLREIHGAVIELGVGTGRNLRYYPRDADVTGVDLSRDMLTIATRRSSTAACMFHPLHDDATVLASVPTNQFDWLVATFLCCVMPDHLQPAAIGQFARVLKPGGRFRLLEMVYSQDPARRRRQHRYAPFVQMVYGARFDRHTLSHLERSPHLRITDTYYLKADTYLVINGVCRT